MQIAICGLNFSCMCKMLIVRCFGHGLQEMCLKTPNLQGYLLAVQGTISYAFSKTYITELQRPGLNKQVNHDMVP